MKNSNSKRWDARLHNLIGGGCTMQDLEDDEQYNEHIDRMALMDDARRDSAEIFEDRLEMFRNEY